MPHAQNDKGIFVVSFPLQTEKWQEDRIDKMLRILSVLYRDKQEALLKRYIHLSHSPEFKEKKEECRKKAKGATGVFQKFMADNGFSEYGIGAFFSQSDKRDTATNEQLVSHGLNSSIVEYLSQSAWKAWEKKLFENGKNIHIDKDISILKSRKKSGYIIGFEYSFSDFHIRMYAQKPKRHMLFEIPFEVNRTSEYELFAMQQEVRNIAITRQEIRGKRKYYVQFSFAGKPYNKGRALGTGVVGIDPGPSKMAIVGENRILLTRLADGIEEDERKTALLRRKLDRSKRATNPEMFNEDGTIKKGVRQSVFSGHYKKTRAELAEAQRKLAAKRKIAHNQLANEVLAMGSEFRVEKNTFAGMQRRAKEGKQNAQGKNLSKKRFGKSLKEHAPSEFLAILKNKVEQYPEGRYVEIPASMACTQFDFTNGEFTKHELKERTIRTSDGRRHDRDALAAFNVKHARLDRVEGRKKMEKDKENFDNEQMTSSYERFCQMEKDTLSHSE